MFFVTGILHNKVFLVLSVNMDDPFAVTAGFSVQIFLKWFVVSCGWNIHNFFCYFVQAVADFCPV